MGAGKSVLPPGVPCSQYHVERECDPVQSPWHLRAHLRKGELLLSVEERRFQ